VSRVLRTKPNPNPQQVNCFIVKKGTPGFKATKIENKIALRCVQNADMLFERCFVPDSARLPGGWWKGGLGRDGVGW